MNKEQLTNAVQKNLSENMKEGVEATKADASRAVNAVLGSLQQGLVNDGAVQLVGYGTFSVKTRKARKGRNPQTGKEIDIPAKNVVQFKPGKQLTESVQEKKAAKSKKKKKKK